jgi:membrane-bound inhibitor of C-type lysozyme
MEAAFDVVNDPSNDRPPDDRLGGQLLSTIFGRQRPAVGDLVGRFAGLRAGGGAWLLSLTAPLALGVLRRKISSTGLNPASMSRLLVWERDRILRAAPDGVESLVDAGGRVPEILGVDRVSAPRPSPAQLWHAVAALALVAGVLFLTRDRRTDAEESGMVGGIPFDCGGRRVAVAPVEDGALLTVGSVALELHRTRTASGARYDATDDSRGTFFWDKGDLATLVIQGDTYPACRRVR